MLMLLLLFGEAAVGGGPGQQLGRVDHRMASVRDFDFIFWSARLDQSGWSGL